VDATSIDADIVTKFESLEEYHQIKPIVVFNKDGIVLYANTKIKNLYNLEEGSSAFLLNSEPSINSIIKKTIEKKLNSFSCDLVVQIQNNVFNNYSLELERILVNKEELFVFHFDPQEKQNNLNEQINTYNKVLDLVNVGVLIADYKAKIKYLSSSFEEFLNKKIDKLYDTHLTSALENFLAANELKELEYSIKNKTKWIKVISNISAEGDVFYKEVRLSILPNNSDRSVNYLITANDITNQIRQTRLLKKSEQRQRSIINNIPNPLLIVRKEQNELILENANSSFCNNIELVSNYSEETELSLILKNDLYSIIQQSIKKIETDNRVHIQFHYSNTKRKKRFIGKVTYTDDHYDNSRIFIVNMNDITEQLEIEKKLRQACENEISLNKLKSSFLANMSHEIRTPLNAIVGYSELLEDDVRAEDYESSTEMTSYLKEGVNRLLNLVDNIVEVSLLESGNIEIELSNTDLNKIIKVNKVKWFEQAKEKGIKFNFEISDEEIFVKANEEKLTKALMEIVFNAIKYNTKNGEVTVVTFFRDGKAEIKIIDSGIGINAEGLKKILNIFEQVEEEAYTRNYEGAGLGLSIASKLITFMGGKLKIKSEINKGTIITVSFPQILKH